MNHRCAGNVVLSCAAVAIWGTIAFTQEPVVTKWVPGPPPAIRPGTTTLVALPDTEVYTQKYPEMFLAQTRWIAANAESRNIAYVVHLGDMVQRGESPDEWRRLEDEFTETWEAAKARGEQSG